MACSLKGECGKHKGVGKILAFSANDL